MEDLSEYGIEPPGFISQGVRVSSSAWKRPQIYNGNRQESRSDLDLVLGWLVQVNSLCARSLGSSPSQGKKYSSKVCVLLIYLF